jgi:hypothetical protein
MSEEPNKPKPGKLKLSKTVVKDMPLRAGQAGKVKGGKTACGGISCVSKS